MCAIVMILVPLTVALPSRLATLSPPARTLVAQALAANSRRTYAAQWRLWCAYAEAHAVALLPASPEAVANWLAIRFSCDGAAIATLRTAVAAIRMAHSAGGEAFDSRHPAITLVLRGAGRSKGHHQKQAAPMRGPLIADLLDHLRSSPRELRDAALLALGYCFARRRAELAALDYGQLGDGDGWLVLTDRTIELHLVRSKSHDGSPEVYVMPRSGNRLAVSAIERWIANADIVPGTPLLRRVLKSGRIGGRLDPQSVTLILRQRIAEHFERQGLSQSQACALAKGYSGHSLRVGFAVSAAEAGASIIAIQRALGHRTPLMAARYAQSADLERTSPHHLEGVSPKVRRGRTRKKRGLA